MISVLAIIAAQAAASVRGTVSDAVTGAPVTAAMVRGTRAVSTTGDGGHFSLDARVGDTLYVRRIGYQPAVAVIAPGDSIHILLEPVALHMSRVDVRTPALVGRHSAVVDVRAIETEGATSLTDLVTRLPFVSARSSRGGVSLSMRGSRPDQVLVLLDGVPLNDPSTGAADISDLPLAALGEVAVIPGAGAASFGSGASGGVLSLNSGSGSTITALAGSYGRAGISAAHSAAARGAVIRAGGEWSYARNDFPFYNAERSSAGVHGSAANERRVNNDERRSAIFASAVVSDAQLTVLASRSERGLVGPMNVHVYDAARGLADRMLVRIAATPRRWTISAASRTLRYRYQDDAGLASRTASVSVDADAGRAFGATTVRFGGGFDRAHGSALVDATRPRLFAATDWRLERRRWRTTVSARADVISGSGTRMSPSVGLELPARITLFARAAQGFRAPALYDLYFASPQRIENARRVDPERVILDAEVGARLRRGSLAISFSIFDRETRDAIVWFPGTFAWRPRNVGRERVNGAEGRLLVTHRDIDIDVWASARNTALRLDVDRVSVPTPYVPRADGGVTARFTFGPATVVSSISAIGRRPIVAVPDPSPAEELPSVALLDLTLSTRASLRSSDAIVSLGARNIAGVQWQQIAGYPSSGRTWSASLTLRPRR